MTLIAAPLPEHVPSRRDYQGALERQAVLAGPAPSATVTYVPDDSTGDVARPRGNEAYTQWLDAAGSAARDRDVIAAYEEFVERHAETFEALANRHTLGRPLPSDADFLAACRREGHMVPDA
jgi:predicted nucleic acid-binding protein